MELPEESNENNQIKRTNLLSVVCILSFVNGLFSLFSHLSNAFMGVSKQQAEETAKIIYEAFPELKEQTLNYYSVWVDAYFTHELTNGILFTMGLIGVYEMFKMRKRGYFMYGVAHLLLSFYPVLFIVHNAFSEQLVVFSALITLLFLILYGSQLKHMKTDTK